MALPATDDFTDNNNTQLTSHSASWSLLDGDFDIQSDALSPDDSGDDDECAAYWNADAFDDDQYSELDIVALSTADGGWHYIGVAVRASSGPDYYSYYGCQQETLMYKVVGGSITGMGTGTTWSPPDTVRIEAEGTTITPILNGSTDSAIGAQTDSSLSSGSAGVSGYWDSTGTRGDDWEGGNLGGAPSVSIPVMMHHYMHN